MKLIYIGVNLCDDMFKGIYNGKEAHASDMEQVIERALDKHVDKLMITGTCYQDILEAVELIEKLKDKFPNRLYTTVGVHPTRCNEFTPTNDEEHRNNLLEIVNKHREHVVVSLWLDFVQMFMFLFFEKAIGECGLDYDRLHYCEKVGFELIHNNYKLI